MQLSRDMLLYYVLAVLLCVSWLYWKRHTRDPYGLFHLSLNEGADTEWLNMGYWEASCLVELS